MDRVTFYMSLVGDARYTMELVEVRESWSGHHDHKKTMFEFERMSIILLNLKIS